MKGLSALIITGCADLLIHWQVFFVLCSAAELTQAQSNFAAFCVAAAFTFYVNVLYTFETGTSIPGYVVLVVVMGGLSVGTGLIADAQDWPGLLTVGVFSVLNLLSGYGFFRLVLFCPKRE